MRITDDVTISMTS